MSSPPNTPPGRPGGAAAPSRQPLPQSPPATPPPQGPAPPFDNSVQHGNQNNPKPDFRPSRPSPPKR